MYATVSTTFRSIISHRRGNNIIATGEITDGFIFSNMFMLKYSTLENFVITIKKTI